MTKGSRWLIIAVCLMAVVALALLWRGCRVGDDRASTTPADFSSGRAKLVSPDLDLELVEMRGTVHPGYTDWTCILTCRENDGCRAAVRVQILYVSGGEKRTLTLSGRLDADRGGTMRIGRVQRPPVAVDRVVEVVVEVTATFTPGAPRPTLRQ